MKQQVSVIKKDPFPKETNDKNDVILRNDDRRYESIEIEIVLFGSEDIIVTSDTGEWHF